MHGRFRPSTWHYLALLIPFILLTYVYQLAIMQTVSTAEQRYRKALGNVFQIDKYKRIKQSGTVPKIIEAVTNCHAVTQIVYLENPRNPKTLTLILQMFALRNNLSVHVSTEHHPKQQLYDIWIQTLGQQSLDEHVLGDSKILTVITEPFEDFISSFKEREMKLKLNKTIDSVSTGSSQFRAISEQLGLQTGNTSEFVKEHGFLRAWDKKLYLVLIQEAFDESLVLLKRHLCWHLNDILYLPSKLDEKDRLIYRDDLRHRHGILAKTDYTLYHHLKQAFLSKLNQEGINFSQEVIHFRSVLKQFQTFCLTPSSATDSLRIESSLWNDAIVITKARCNDFKR